MLGYTESMLNLKMPLQLPQIFFFFFLFVMKIKNYTKPNKNIFKITFDPKKKKKKNHTQIYEVLPFLFTEFPYFEIVA